MTPDELRKLADEATPGGRWGWAYVVEDRALGEDDAAVRLIALAPDLARLCAELGEALDDIAVSLGEGRCPKWKREMLAKHARPALAKLSELNNGAEASPTPERTQ